MGDRPSVGTVRRGWFPSKHTTCKRQLPDTRPHQAIVTVSLSSSHLSFQSMRPTSSDPPRVVVPRYARLNVPFSFSLCSFRLAVSRTCAHTEGPSINVLSFSAIQVVGVTETEETKSSTFFHSSARGGYMYTLSCYVFLSSYPLRLSSASRHSLVPVRTEQLCGACWAQVSPFTRSQSH